MSLTFKNVLVVASVNVVEKNCKCVYAQRSINFILLEILASCRSVLLIAPHGFLIIIITTSIE